MPGSFIWPLRKLLLTFDFECRVARSSRPSGNQKGICDVFSPVQAKQYEVICAWWNKRGCGVDFWEFLNFALFSYSLIASSNNHTLGVQQLSGFDTMSDLIHYLFAILPALICAIVAWSLVKPRRLKMASVLGAVSGLVGTLIWPTGSLILHCVRNQDHLEMGGLIVMVIAALMVGSAVVGAVVTTVLTTVARYSDSRPH